MNSNLPNQHQGTEWTDSEEDTGDDSCQTEHNESSGARILIRQDSIHDLASKILIRQNSLHNADGKISSSLNTSNERSLSWDNYVDNYKKDSDEILEGLKEIREQLKESDDEEISSEEEFKRKIRSYGSESSSSRRSQTLSIDSHAHYRPSLSQSSSKNTQSSGEVSDLSFESHWNSKRSVSLETYNSHLRNRDAFESSSGITSISEDADSNNKSSSLSSRHQTFRSPFDSSEDPYEYDDEIAISLTSKIPSVDEDLMAKGKKRRKNKLVNCYSILNTFFFRSKLVLGEGGHCMISHH